MEEPGLLLAALAEEATARYESPAQGAAASGKLPKNIDAEASAQVFVQIDLFVSLQMVDEAGAEVAAPVKFSNIITVHPNMPCDRVYSIISAWIQAMGMEEVTHEVSFTKPNGITEIRLPNVRNQTVGRVVMETGVSWERFKNGDDKAWRVSVKGRRCQ